MDSSFLEVLDHPREEDNFSIPRGQHVHRSLHLGHKWWWLQELVPP